MHKIGSIQKQRMFNKKYREREHLPSNFYQVFPREP